MSATTFAARLDTAGAHERAVIARLVGAGWAAFPFGQSQLPDACRARLKRYEDAARRPTLIRWLPDVITVGRFVALLDAKCCGGTAYAIERSAVETADVLTDSLYTPTFFVFDDFRVVTPRDARQRGRVGPAPRAGNGSGTPYLLIDKMHGRAFDDVFRPIAQGNP